MKSRLIVALVLGVAAWAQARQDDNAGQHETLERAGPQIVVTINPEARVSAVIGAALPSRLACSSPIRIEIKVINQGFVTAALRATIAGDGGRHVTLDSDGAKLSGAPEENRTLWLLMHGPTPIDLTIAFSIDDSVGDLAGRDRVHLLLRCHANSV